MKAFVDIPPRGVAVPLLVSIPHTGTEVPADVAGRLAASALRDLPMTDWHLHKLYDFLPPMGIATVHARFSRLAIDLNRPPDAAPLYPGRFETGLVAQQTFDGEPIFREPPDADTIESLRRRYHAPYHERLAQRLREGVGAFGTMLLVDAHSVASRANRLHPALDGEIYLGDRDGTACKPWLTEFFMKHFENAGLTVRLNDPYKGGYVTQHYGQWPGVEAIQIEMAQRLYMNEDHPQRLVEEKWKKMKTILASAFASLAQRLERD